MSNNNPTTIQQDYSIKGKTIHNPTTTTNHNFYNNNYNINTEPGVFILSPEDGARICKAYTDSIGPLNGTIANMITSFMKQGLTLDDIILAIEETAFAPRPSAAYLRAILRNWLRDGRTIARARHASQHDTPDEWWRAKPVKNYDDITDYPW